MAAQIGRYAGQEEIVRRCELARQYMNQRNPLNQKEAAGKAGVHESTLSR